MKVHLANPKNVHEVTGYSHVGYFDAPARVLYISGQVARNEKGEVVGVGSVEIQARQVFQNISNILSSMGASLGNLIKLNIYTTRLDQVQAIRRVRDEFITGEKPCSTLVGVTGLVSSDYLIEIEAVAVMDPLSSS
jgi:2-iminobutanoate/2-iminopropanoate deaminase